jgi:hypothetical protein
VARGQSEPDRRLASRELKLETRRQGQVLCAIAWRLLWPVSHTAGLHEKPRREQRQAKDQYDQRHALHGQQIHAAIQV